MPTCSRSNREVNQDHVHNVHRLTALAADHGAPLSLTPDDIDFLDAIYRGRYPAESGLLPLGDPTAVDAERAVTLADNSLATLDRFLANRSPREVPEPSASTSTCHQPDGDDSC